ncbi:hypothetical protein Agub_g1522 [Astrephomene gubernaculifera]|uniref:EGF-like domain-containing protein n=1 Tax=Astrephomene gubernaculifera TaxID=47775 RepID=A0AAD3DFH9_9CHLO|nr:hypothetical protein Agub_g1522 [Astrephomene gubernaculifera]
MLWVAFLLVASGLIFHDGLASASEQSGSSDWQQTHNFNKERKLALTEQAPIPLRCSVTKGSWCTKFLIQEPITWKPAPRGNKECPDNCNNVGRCNYDTGYCDCPAGWRGPGCKTRQKRPCTTRQRAPEDHSPDPISSIGPDKRDTDWTDLSHIYSRCGGVCDDDTAICYCDGPMGRIPAPEDSPPGTAPARRGRPLITYHMAPKTTWDGRKAFGDVEYDFVYGPKGYCNVTKPEWVAVCGLDDLGGPTCDDPVEAFCPGACSGHGTCNLGFCICDEGYYGHDCARRKAGLPLQPSTLPTKPWLASVLHEPPAALEPPPKATRKRPLIYVYDLEPLYQSKLLQYRVSPTWCVFRRHEYPNNHTTWTDVWVYAADTLVHEFLLISEHRTFDPEEADYFYVPHYASCLPFPIGVWADYPWFKGPGGPRVRQMVNMLLETVDWINTTYPYWQRRGGKDHIFLFTHDEGACWAPNVVNNSIWLTHWGRMDVNHTSNTAFVSDRYDEDYKSWQQPEGFLTHIKGHPCYNPEKDLIIPAFKRPEHYRLSPLVSANARPRDNLFFFRGDVGKGRLAMYSRGVRQKIYKMAKEGGWAAKYKFYIGDGSDVQGDYSDMLSRSTFCLVAAGDGWSARLEDAVLHGCIPVIICDNVHVVFESILDIDSFAVRIPEADTGRILEILQAIPERKVRAKQAHLGHAWHRFRYSSLPGLASELWGMMENSLKEIPLSPAANNSSPTPDVVFPRPFKGDPAVDDAFATIVQWLYSRIPHTR